MQKNRFIRNICYGDKTEKTRQGRGKHSKYSATSRNSARKRYRGQGKMKLKRIDKYGCRGQIPVDMSEDFYNNGNEYCRYLITDYRASLLRKK